MRTRFVAVAVAAATVLAGSAAVASDRDICVDVDERNATASITTAAKIETFDVPVHACIPFM